MALRTYWCLVCLHVPASPLSEGHFTCFTQSQQSLSTFASYVACVPYCLQTPDLSVLLQETHAELQKQEIALSSRVTALDEEAESLKAILTKAEKQVSDLEQQLASHAETHQATLEALEKQAETLQVCTYVSGVTVTGLSSSRTSLPHLCYMQVPFSLYQLSSPHHTLQAVVAIQVSELRNEMLIGQQGLMPLQYHVMH